MLCADSDKRGDKMLRSVIIAFSMYSRIPMPKTEWDERAMRYAMCFFPLVGAVLGATALCAAALMNALGAGTLLFSAVMTVLPIILTGGIHMDGFIDTSDAAASYADKGKRLEILKDPHIGAFSVIYTAVYFVLMMGIWSEATAPDIPVIAIGCILSRSLSGLSVVKFPLAKNTGLAAAFSSAADKKRTAAVLVVWAAAAVCASVFIDARRGIAMTFAALVVFFIYRYTSVRRFGGITGDLAGWFLQICEGAVAAAVIAAGRFL